MTYETGRAWRLEGLICGVCCAPAMCAPSDGGGDDKDYLFYCQAGCTSSEVYDQEDPSDYFAKEDPGHKQTTSIPIVTGLNENDYKPASERAPRYDFELTLSTDEKLVALLDPGEHACVAVVSADRSTITFKVPAGKP